MPVRDRVGEEATRGEECVGKKERGDVPVSRNRWLPVWTPRRNVPSCCCCRRGVGKSELRTLFASLRDLVVRSINVASDPQMGHLAQPPDRAKSPHPLRMRDWRRKACADPGKRWGEPQNDFQGATAATLESRSLPIPVLQATRGDNHFRGVSIHKQHWASTGLSDTARAYPEETNVTR